MINKQEILNNLYFQFDSKTVLRGQNYYKSGFVKSCDTKIDEDGDIIINSLVDGTFLYSQDILIDGDNYSIDGDCSCPVGYNCKHVAAAIFQYLANPMEITVKGKNSYESWLNKLALQEKEQEI